MRDYDVVCVGGGGAGVTAATTAAASGANVLLLSKEPVGYGSTRLAGGAMASCGIVSQDSPAIFLEDLLIGGEHLNNAKLAQVLTQEARMAAAAAEGSGVIFQRDSLGCISREVAIRPGGHRYHRAVVTPARGIALGHALRAACAKAKIDLLEETATTHLLLDGRRVAGLVGWKVAEGVPVIVRARSVVLATGGLGALYFPHTDCMPSATGDGYALAYEAGAELVDMEQVQFLPFACTHPDSMVGVFLAEPLHAGRYGRLLDRLGHEVMTNINTMTRAQVSRVIGMEVSQGNGTPNGGLLLDLRPNLQTPHGRTAWQRMREEGLLDVVKRAYGPKAHAWEDPWDVAPTAHFHMGGVRIDECGATTVPGLFAAGEVAGGLHGANRLGGVALTELFVFGRRAGESAAAFARDSDQSSFPREEAAARAAELTSLVGARGEHRPTDLIRRLRKSMWDNCGVVRNEQQIGAALRESQHLKTAVASLQVCERRSHNSDILAVIELRKMLLTAEMVARSAQSRRESRGAHIRSDYPERDDQNWCANISLRSAAKTMCFTVEPIEQLPAAPA